MLIFSLIPYVMALLAGLVLFVFGKSRRLRRSGLFFTLALTGIAIVFIFVGAIMEPEWNPEIGSDQEITGVWTEGHDRLELSADGHYIYGTPPAIKTGTWTREGWNLYLKPGVFDQFENFTLMRFIEYHGHYRILTHPPDEPDELFFDHGLSKN